MRKHYGMPVIVLIDEYDVPLDKAYQNGYYPQMVNLIRSVFSQVLKTNENLEFAVITGCLQIAKESIFTGLNNFKVRTGFRCPVFRVFWVYGPGSERIVE